MIIPNLWDNIKFMFQTTDQIVIIFHYHPESFHSNCHKLGGQMDPVLIMLILYLIISHYIQYIYIYIQVSNIPFNQHFSWQNQPSLGHGPCSRAIGVKFLVAVQFPRGDPMRTGALSLKNRGYITITSSLGKTDYVGI